MSELRVALVAEGPTDAVVIEAALKALLPGPFVVTLLQPEPTSAHRGGGWGGVLRWSRDFTKRGYPLLEQDPTLERFDLFVLHLDADVAECSYSDLGTELEEESERLGWSRLPSAHRCPPSSASADSVRERLMEWAGLVHPGPRTVVCVPSKSIEAWLAGAVFDTGHELLDGLECNLGVSKRLAELPKGQRIRKTAREYRAREREVTVRWATVRERCEQAERFSREVLNAVGPLSGRSTERPPS